MSEADTRNPTTPVRFAALGDSATFGIGDPVDRSWRGWASLLADAIAAVQPVSFRNLAIPGSTAADVRRDQLTHAIADRPHLASLVVGLNDTMRSQWCSMRILDDLQACAEALTAGGATLLLPRFHDHARVFRIPAPLARPLVRRIERVNEVYDLIEATYGGIRVDLDRLAHVYTGAFWSVDRLHPSELGHRVVARAFAENLNERGFGIPLPSLTCTGQPASRSEDIRWMATEAVPWIGRRARDFGGWTVRRTVSQLRDQVRGAPDLAMS